MSSSIIALAANRLRRSAEINQFPPANFDFFTDFSGGLLPNSLTGREVEPPSPAGVVSWQQPSAARFVQTVVTPPGTSHALAFVYPATAEGVDSNVEQNLLLGQMVGGAGRYFGMEFDVLFPENFTYREPGTPNKFFQFWEQYYSNTCTVGITLLADSDGAGIVQPFITGYSPEYGFYGLGQCNPKVFPLPAGERLIAPVGATAGAITPGVWSKIRYLVKFSSSAEALDGTVKIWVDGDLFMTAGPNNIWSYDVAGPNPPTREPKIGRGYLMGYSNSGFDEETSFYWANLRIVDYDPGWTPIYENDFNSGSLTPTWEGVTEYAPNTLYWQPNHGGQVNATNPISGSHSLNFIFPVSADGADSNEEQRFRLPRDCTGGFGMEWDQRISSNFFLRDQTDPSGTTSKWWQLWQGEYTDYSNHTTVGCSFRRSGEGNQVEIMAVVTDTGCTVCNANYTSPSSFGRVLIDPDTPANGIIKPGQVHNIKWRVKFSSGPTENDGLWELLVDDVVFATFTGALYSPASRGSPIPSLRFGYLMGYTNAGYNQVTTWTWDNLKMYNTTERWW